MGLEEKFIQNGSAYGAGQGGNSANLQTERDAIIGNKQQSKLHFDYSINGNPEILGAPNPSILDLQGVTPTTPNRDGGELPINNTFSHGTYKNSAPDAGVGRI